MSLQSLFPRRVKTVLGIFSATLVALSATATAADGTWNVDADGTWSTASNWASNTIADGAGFNAIFNKDLSAARTITLDTSRTLGGIRVGDSGTTTRVSYTLAASGGSVLTLDNGASDAVIAQSVTSNGDTISAPLLLNSSLSLLNLANDKTLTLSGTISSNTAGLKTITMTGQSVVTTTNPVTSNLTTGTATLSGVISNGSAGQVALKVDSISSSTLILSGANTFTGGVTLNKGVLVLNNNAAAGATGALTINGGIISTTSGTRITLASGIPVMLNGSFGASSGSQALDIGSGAAVTMARSLTVSTLAGQFSIYGTIGDGGNAYKLTKDGFGNLYLTGNNTFSGGVEVSSGILIFSQPGALGTGGANVLVKYGASLSMNYSGANQALLNRIDPASVGAVVFWSSAGSSNALDFSNLPGMRLGTTGTGTYSGTLTPAGTTFRLGGGGGTLTVSSALTGTGRSLEVGIKGISVGNVTLSGASTYDGSTTIYGPATLQLNGNTGSIADTSSIVISGNGTFRYDNTGAAAAISETVGDLQFSNGDGTVLSQRTAAQSTTLTFATMSRAAGATGNFTVGGTGASFSVNQVAVAAAPASGQFLSQGLFAGGSNYAAYDSGGYLRPLAYGTDADTATAAAGATLGAASGKHADQTGTLTAQTTDSIRTLRISSNYNTTLATGATLTISDGGILKAGNNTATISGGTGLTTGGNVELVIRTDQSSDLLTINSSILSTSTGGLTKSGAGTLVLAGTNGYTGLTTVNAGTLRILGTEALGAGGVVLNGGTLELRAGTTSPGANNGTPETFVFGQDVTMAADASITLNSLGANSLTQNKTLEMGGLTFGGNTLTVSNNNGYGLNFTGTITLSPGSTGNSVLSLANSRPSNLVPALTFSGKVTGASQLTIRGSGTLLLTNELNDFTGTLRVTGGVLAVSSDGAMGDASNMVRLAEATSTASSAFRATDTFASSRTFVLGNALTTANIFQVINGKTFTLNSAFSGGFGFTKMDNGTFEINAANTGWDGDVLIHDGVLKVSNSAALGTTSGITQVNNIGAALHLNGGAAGVTIADNLFLFSSGINSSGALLSLAGAGINTVSGVVTLNGAASIGVEAGGKLELTNTTAITGNTDVTSTGQLGSSFALTLAGGGEGSLAAPIATGSSTLTKLGAGTWTLTGTSTFTGTALVNQGTLVLSGAAGKLASGSAWQISPGATLVLDNTNGHLDNRLGTRGVHFGGNITVIGDASADTLETITSSNLVSGNTASTLTLDADATRALTFRITGGSFTRSGQGTSLYRGDNLGSTPGAGVATMLASTAPTFVGQTGTSGAINRGILPWIIVDTSPTGLGAAFATYSSTNGIMALNAVAGEQAAYVLATANVALTSAKSILGPVTVNSLNLGSGGAVTNLPLQTLTLDSGGLLAFSGNSGIQGGILSTTSNRDVIVHALGDITINAVIANTTGGLTKAEAGTLTLGQRNYYTGSTSINQGTLKLAGGDNTLVPGQIMNLNYGGTLDLNGTAQTLGALRSYGSSGNETPIYGGTVTSSGGTATLVTSTSSSTTFAGQITGNVSVGAALGGGATWVLAGDNTYSGTTLIAGGIVNVRNDGRISDTSAISIQYGTLRLDNTILSDNADRVADDAAISMSGGTLNFFGRQGSFSSETVGNVTLNQGMNIITSTVSSNNGNLMPQAAVLTLTSLGRNAAAGATVNFGQTYSGTSAERLGLVASSSGSSENILVTGGLPTVNNIVGPWAVYTNYFNTNAVEFVGYDAAGGVGALNIVGFAGYDGTSLPASSQPTQNIRTNVDATVAAGGLTINTLNFIGSSTTPNRVLTFANDTDVLNLAAGGLIFSVESSGTITGALGAASGNGRITAGGTNPAAPVDLFLYYQNNNAANALTVNAAIIDNPTNNQSVRLIVSGTVFGQFPVILATTLNSYSGGTVVNGTLLQVGSATAAGNLPAGGLTINGGTVTQVNGTIAAQDVTLNGSAVMNLAGTNTLNAITFNNNGGGSVTPSISIASGGTLNMAGGIAATSSNPTSTATISGGTLSLNGASRTVNVAPITFNGQNISSDQATLNITSVISGSGAGVVKTGAGLLQLSGANTFSGGVDLQQGGLIIANNSALGSGTLSLGNNTTLTADASTRAVTNAVTVGGDFTMGVRGVTAPGALTLSGPVAWGSTTHQVTVDSNPATVQTISGAISGSGGLVKAGIGTLALTGNNSTTLNWTEAGDVKVSNGTLRIASDTSLGAAPSTATAGNIVVSNGALGNTATLTLDSRRGIALGDAAGSGTGSLEAAASTTLTYNGVITDNGTGADSLVKTGTGTVSLGGASTYTGHTTITAGTLALGSGGSINSSDRITVNTGATFDVASVSGGYSVKSGQTLEGGGTVSGGVTALSGATIAPGTVDNRVADKLVFTGVVTLDSGSVLQLDINAPTFTSTDHFGGNAPGTAGYNSYVTTNGAGQKEHDLLSAGTLTQNAGAQIQVLAASVIPVEGQIFNLLDWTTAFNTSSNLGDIYRDGAADSSTDLDLPDLSSYGLMWDISNFASAGVLVVVVPEPGRCLLLGLAFAALLGRRRRRRM